MKLTSRFALCIVCTALLAPACDDGSKKKGGDKQAKGAKAKGAQQDTKAKDAKAKDAKDAKAKDAKAKDAKQDTKAKATDKKDGGAEGGGGQDAPAASEASKKFRKGQPAPRGMSPEDVKAYAEAQGDPLKGEFTLEQALEGDDALADKEKGKLMATFDTTMGKFECELYEDKTPHTVANFVGLARGVRPSYDKEKDEWVNKPFYDGIVFHRVIKGFMIQTGDPSGSGSGGPGFVVVDEFDKSLKHSTKGLLSMANRGPNTGSSQFFVTVAKTPHLDGKHAIFGKCNPKVPTEISEVKVDARRNHRPYEPVMINTITFARK